MVQPAAAGESVVQVELGAVKETVDVGSRGGGNDKLLSLTYPVEIASTRELTLGAVRGAVYAGGVSLTPAAGLR